ncbi:MAG: DNA replication/repair protein RecF [Ignavibacteria bacterium]|nr:DNA replication/repair protein RecF [Ignavibacteria bacterium]
MQLSSLRLRNFRKHGLSQLDFADGVNILVGDNGQGKTNILEAISFLSLTKSFLSASDSFVCKHGEELFDVAGKMISDNGVEYNVRVAHQISTAEKVFTINKQNVEPRSSVLGKFPIVILSPHHSAITFGSPSERRAFVDFVLCQSSRVYLEQLQTFRRILKHRNAFLHEAKISRKQLDNSFETWNEQFIEASANVIKKRNEFIQHFQTYVATAYEEIVERDEQPSLTYAPQISLTNNSSLFELEMLLSEELQKEKLRELAIGNSVVGPHHDEIDFRLNGFELRKFASQGQHKTFLVALKMAEFHYLKNACSETPMFLLDDVFSELDEQRAQKVLDLVRKHGQTFVTTTNSDSLDEILLYGEENKKFTVDDGKVLNSQLEYNLDNN